MKKFVTLLLLVSMAFLTVSCTNTIKNLGKSEIDMVSDAIIASNTEYIQKLTLHLYEYNPDELRKATTPTSIEARLTQIVEYPTSRSYAELRYTTTTNTLRLFFDKDFKGDRVFALLIGIHSMLRFSYNNQTEFFMFDELDPQILYNSARNLETILAWLYLDTKQEESLLRFTTVTPENSFHNTMVKIIANQDLMAKIISQRTHRTVNRIVHGTAGIMLPI